jgi:hypothetical protein
LAQWQSDLQQLDAAADLAALEAAEQRALQLYQQEARRISQGRGKAAPKLAQAITQAMQGLGMQGGRFEVALETCEPAAHGLEDVAFLVAGHPGSTPRPVGKVASGGELSRIALAIAVTTSRLGEAQTLIFDEVDSGVGGAVAETVGRLMKQLGVDRQVLAVTHLAQVAACADRHFVVVLTPSFPNTLPTKTADLLDVLTQMLLNLVMTHDVSFTLFTVILMHFFDTQFALIFNHFLFTATLNTLISEVFQVLGDSLSSSLSVPKDLPAHRALITCHILPCLVPYIVIRPPM